MNTISEAALREPDRVERSEDGRAIRYQWVLSSKPDPEEGRNGTAEILAELRVDYELRNELQADRGLVALLHRRDVGRAQIECSGCEGAGCERCEGRGYFTMRRETIQVLGDGGVQLAFEQLYRFSAKRFEAFAEAALVTLRERFEHGADQVLRYFDQEES